MFLKKLFTQDNEVTVEERKTAPPPPQRAPRRNFAQIYPGSMKLKVLVTENPKRKGTRAYARFERYYKSSTVQEALNQGVQYSDMSKDLDRKYIEVTDD